MPAASLLISPARSISLWLTSSASAGASLSVERKNRDRRMLGFVLQSLDFNSVCDFPGATEASTARGCGGRPPPPERAEERPPRYGRALSAHRPSRDTPASKQRRHERRPRTSVAPPRSYLGLAAPGPSRNAPGDTVDRSRPHARNARGRARARQERTVRLPFRRRHHRLPAHVRAPPRSSRLHRARRLRRAARILEP